MRKQSTIAIGIDTGGTNTDAAIVDVVRRTVLASAKAPTTCHDYAVGIREALCRLPADLVRCAARVGVSTTLATNAISTGTGEAAGLLLLGYPPATRRQVRFEPQAGVAGAMSITGEPLEALDEAALLREARRMIERHRVTALAVSGFASVMNPQHERRAAEVLRQAFGVPVVEAHQLSMRLGAADRAVTAGWNARLLANIDRLLTAVERTCADMGLSAPIVVIRADGSAMPAAAARLRPVETILSGPAASLEGGLALGGRREVIVVDVGGTTTDIALAVGGGSAVRDEVAIVGGYTLAVRAVQEYTVALGGDSYVQVTHDGLSIGPRRVVPLCVLAARWPQVREQLAELAGAEDASFLYQPADVFAPASPDGQASNGDRVMQALAAGPLTRQRLAAALQVVHPSLVRVADLLDSGRVVLSALTPTDCLAALGRCRIGDVEAARLGLALYARRAQTAPETLAASVLERFQEMLSLAILRARLIAGGLPDDRVLADEAAAALIHGALRGGNGLPVDVSLRLREPIIAEGAPAAAYVPQAGERLGAHVIVPEAAGVAAAVGAALAGQAVRSTATICPTATSQVSVHSEQGRYVFDTLEEANAFAAEHLAELVRGRARQFEMGETVVDVRFTPRCAEVLSAAGTEPLWLETRVVAEGTAGLERKD